MFVGGMGWSSGRRARIVWMRMDGFWRAAANDMQRLGGRGSGEGVGRSARLGPTDRWPVATSGVHIYNRVVGKADVHVLSSNSK